MSSVYTGSRLRKAHTKTKGRGCHTRTPPQRRRAGTHRASVLPPLLYTDFACGKARNSRGGQEGAVTAAPAELLSKGGGACGGGKAAAANKKGVRVGGTKGGSGQRGKAGKQGKASEYSRTKLKGS